MPFGVECHLTRSYKPAKKSSSFAATFPLLLSDNHNRGIFYQVAFHHISESTKQAKFRMAPVDSSLKVAYSKVSSTTGSRAMPFGLDNLVT